MWKSSNLKLKFRLLFTENQKLLGPPYVITDLLSFPHSFPDSALRLLPQTSSCVRFPQFQTIVTAAINCTLWIIFCPCRILHSLDLLLSPFSISCSFCLSACASSPSATDFFSLPTPSCHICPYPCFCCYTSAMRSRL
jgi:hypothetical protein